MTPELQTLLPIGLRLLEVTKVPYVAPAFCDQLQSTTFVATKPAVTVMSDDALRAALAAFYAAESCLVRVVRKKKPRLMDARRQITAAEVLDHGLSFTIAFGETGTLKPAEALAALLGKEAARGLRLRKTCVALAVGKADSADTRVVPGNRSVMDLTEISERQPAQRPASRPKKNQEPVTVPYVD